MHEALPISPLDALRRIGLADVPNFSISKRASPFSIYFLGLPDLVLPVYFTRHRSLNLSVLDRFQSISTEHCDYFLNNLYFIFFE
jgi:hypothetical protein